MKNKCVNCKKGHKVLTKENLCAKCYLEKKGEWPSTFKGAKEKNKKGFKK